MTNQTTTVIEATPNPPASVLEEINLLRGMNQQATTWFEECQTVPDRLRYLATISMSCTRVATLLKIEHLLNGSENGELSLSATLSETLAEMDSGE